MIAAAGIGARRILARLVSAVMPDRRMVRLPWIGHTLALLRRGISEFREDHCPQMAAAIAFHLLFSMFPLAIMAVGILGLITQDPHARDTVTSAVLGIIPLSSHGRQQLHGLITSVNGGASALGLLGLAGVLWSASGVMAAVRTALNIAWDTDAKRPFLRGKLVDLALVAGAFLAIGATFGVTLAASIIRGGTVHLPQPLRSLALIVVTAASVALLFATFAFLYRFVPAVSTRVRGIWPGALTAAAGFETLQYGFSVYVAFFGHYNKVYGSLGAIIAFMFFVYLAAMVFLFGAEIASEYPRLRGGRLTSGPESTGSSPYRNTIYFSRGCRLAGRQRVARWGIVRAILKRGHRASVARASQPSAVLRDLPAA